VEEVIFPRRGCILPSQQITMNDINTKTTCATASGKFKERAINVALVVSALMGTGFFLTHWNRGITDATVFSAILVEIPIQVLIKRQKQ
jgi:hypothetical protein